MKAIPTGSPGRILASSRNALAADWFQKMTGGQAEINQVPGGVRAVGEPRGRRLRLPSLAPRRFGLDPWSIHKEILEDERAFASLERTATTAAYNLAIRRRSRFGANQLVLCGAMRAVEAALDLLR